LAFRAPQIEGAVGAVLKISDLPMAVPSNGAIRRYAAAISFSATHMEVDKILHATKFAKIRSANSVIGPSLAGGGFGELA